MKTATLLYMIAEMRDCEAMQEIGPVWLLVHQWLRSDGSFICAEQFSLN